MESIKKYIGVPALAEALSLPKGRNPENKKRALAPQKEKRSQRRYGVI